MDERRAVKTLLTLDWRGRPTRAGGREREHLGRSAHLPAVGAHGEGREHDDDADRPREGDADVGPVDAGDVLIAVEVAAEHELAAR